MDWGEGTVKKTRTCSTETDEGGHGHPLQYSCLENSHGQRSLVDYSPWGRKELHTTEHLSTVQKPPEESLGF